MNKGKINEKERKGEKNKGGADLAFLLHSLFGLDHYPNYLQRWSLPEITRLEDALCAQLSKVRSQKEELLKKPTFSGDPSRLQPSRLYLNDILHPRAKQAYATVFQDHAVSTVQDVLELKNNISIGMGAFEAWIDDPAIEEVYTFPVFTEQFCSSVVHEALQRNQEMGKQRIQAAVGLKVLGLQWVAELCLRSFVEPLSRALYPDLYPLDWNHAYIVSYDSTERDRLVSHTDDAEVTFNLGLGLRFDGGELQFNGLRGTRSEGKVQGQLRSRLGWAVLHRGRHLHEVAKVTTGHRYGLIVWTRNHTVVRAETCPCCWLNRRSPASDCICGAQWN